MKNYIIYVVAGLFFLSENAHSQISDDVFENWTDEQYEQYEDSIRNILYPQPVSVDDGSIGTDKLVKPDDKVSGDNAITKASSMPVSFVPDKSKEPGQITIISGTTPYGAKTYSVPIDVYSGLNGHQPSLSLYYNSQLGNSVVGTGWTINGLSMITRGNKSLYYDGVADGVSLKKDDALFLDGMRLICYSSTTSEQYYETETGNIKVKGYCSGDIIKYFEVFYPDGNKGVYGYKSNVDSKAAYPITSLHDLNGNIINYTYDLTDNFYYITSIYYNNYNNCRVAFRYSSDRPDPQIGYSGGVKTTLKKRLNSIECRFGNEIIGEYYLSYTVKNNSSLLSKIEFRSSLKAYNPISLYYGTDSTLAYYTSDKTTLGTYYKFDAPNAIRVARGKINYGKESDGIVVFPNKTPYWQHYRHSTAFRHSEHRFDNYYDNFEEKIYVYPSIQSSYTNPVANINVERGFIDIFPADLSGSGKDYLVKVNNYADGDNDKVVFKVYSPAPGGTLRLFNTFTFNFKTLIEDAKGAKSIHPKFYYAGDFDGDGKMEILGVSVDSPLGDSSRQSCCYIFDLNDGKVRFEKNLFKFTYIFTGTRQADATDASNRSDKLLVFDYNGDGKTDLCHINADGLHIYTFDKSGGIYNGRRVGTYGEINRLRLENRQLLAGDVNGDGLVDIMVSPSSVIGGGYWTMHRSCGNCDFDKEETRIVKNDDSVFTGFIAQDINGDGRCDLINYRSARFDTFLSNGTGISSTAIGEDYSASKGILVPADINSFGSHVQLIFLKDGEITKYTYTRSGYKDRLLTCMINSLGVIEHNFYERLGDNDLSHEKGVSLNYPYVSINDGVEILTRSSVYVDGLSQGSKQYNYVNAVFHRQGRGFQGFDEIRCRDERNLTYVCKYDPYNFGVLEEESSPERKILSTYKVEVAQNKIAKALLMTKREEDLLKNNAILTAYSYDDFGYPVEECTTFDDGSSILVKSKYSSESRVADGYNLGFLVDMTRTVTIKDESFSERLYIPAHARRNPYVKVEYKDGNQVKNTVYSYDTYGNVLSESIKLYSGTKEQKTLYGYDLYGRVIRKTDPLGLVNEYYYNQMGNLATVKDYRGGMTTYSYDAMHREIKRIYPDSTTLTKTYRWSGSYDYGLYAVETEMMGKPQKTVYYDALNREAGNSTIMASFVNLKIMIRKEYDTFGNLKKESLPHVSGATPNWNVYGYDMFNRLVSKEEATGRTTKYEYSGRSVAETVNGVKKKKTYDVMDRLVEITGDEGSVAYIYAPDGQIVRIAAFAAPTVEYTYDKYRRKISEKDSSHGLTRYEYDNDGNISKKIDADNKVTVYTYDEFNRLRIINAPDFYARYMYTKQNDLDAVDADKYIKQFIYDKYGRVVSSRETVRNAFNRSKILQRDYTYEGGNIKTIHYSSDSGKIVTEIHDYKSGCLSRVRISGQEPMDSIIYNVRWVNEFGKPTEVYSGIALKRFYTYDDFGYPVKREIILSAVSDSYLKALDRNDHYPLKESYEYDLNTGNLLVRNNDVAGVKESFTYDKLDRLTGTESYAVSYDVKGNIMRRSDVGTFRYERGANPYMMTSAEFTVPNFPTVAQEIEYSSFRRPLRIAENGYQADFIYNDKFDRVVMNIAYEGKDSLTRYYLGGCYEVDVKSDGTTEKLYIGGDYYTASAVLINKSGKGWKRYDIIRDNLGSVISVVDADLIFKSNPFTGVRYLQPPISYDAWGRIRNPETLAPNDVRILVLGRGFCGHEHLPMFGLINMNARLYDPMTGRFLSPDPYVQQSESPQNYNRYSYCLNNPLKYTDRSGELFFFDDFFIGFFKGAFKGENVFKSGWTHVQNSFNIWKGLYLSDSNKKFWGSSWELFSRFTWQFPQTLLGFLSSHAYNRFGNVTDVTTAYGATVLRTNSIGSAVTIGNYIIGNSTIRADANNSLFQHEYGHYLQSQTFGPLYLFMVGVPSILSASKHNGEHKFQKFEIDASRRAFLYFNKYVEKFYYPREEYYGHTHGWDFEAHPVCSESQWNISKYVEYDEINSRYSIYGWKGFF